LPSDLSPDSIQSGVESWVEVLTVAALAAMAMCGARNSSGVLLATTAAKLLSGTLVGSQQQLHGGKPSQRAAAAICGDDRLAE
jgi:hypothetical protein